MEILSMMVITLIGVVTAVVLKSYKPEFGFMVILILAFFFLGWLITILIKLKTELMVLAGFYQENSFYYGVLMKIIGITYLCEFTSGICKDAGYSSIAAQVEMAGRVLVLLASIPVILSVISVISNYKI